MNHPMLPGMIDTYVRLNQHELEQKARLNELVCEAVEANPNGRISMVAAPVRGLIRVVAGVVLGLGFGSGTR